MHLQPVGRQPFPSQKECHHPSAYWLVKFHLKLNRFVGERHVRFLAGLFWKFYLTYMPKRSEFTVRSDAVYLPWLRVFWWHGLLLLFPLIAGIIKKCRHCVVVAVWISATELCITMTVITALVVLAISADFLHDSSPSFLKHFFHRTEHRQQTRKCDTISPQFVLRAVSMWYIIAPSIRETLQPATFRRG